MRLKVTLKTTDEAGNLLRNPDVTVSNADTGEPLDYVTAVSFSADTRSTPVLKVEMFGFEAEVEQVNHRKA